jgi:hypothetical protein
VALAMTRFMAVLEAIGLKDPKETTSLTAEHKEITRVTFGTI